VLLLWVCRVYIPRDLILFLSPICAMNLFPLLITPVYPVVFLDDSFLFLPLILPYSNRQRLDRGGNQPSTLMGASDPWSSGGVTKFRVQISMFNSGRWFLLTHV
jgi:hypothetical protein